MRIGVTSDIHTDISAANGEVARHLAHIAGRAELDALIICGDISPDIMVLSRTLSAFHHMDPKCKKMFVAGNHDIWLIGMKKEVTSHDKYSLITAICDEYGFHHLGDSPVVIGEVGFCGTIGWYDYSYKVDKYNIPEESYMEKTLSGAVWNDVNYARWNGSDPEIARKFEMELQEQIDSIKDNVSQIVVATHHIPFKECVLYRNRLPWDFFSAFMGSPGLGDICVNEPKVTHALFGHTHSDFFDTIRGVLAICSPIGYLTKPPRNLRKYVQNKLKIIELSSD